MERALITTLLERGAVGGYDLRRLARFLAAATEERDRLRAELEAARRRRAEAEGRLDESSIEQLRVELVLDARRELDARRAAARAEAEAILAAAELEAEAILAGVRKEAERPCPAGAESS